jgi:hypothetical protein
MKLVKSLLLGSAAGLAAVAGAQAADLPVRKAAPVEYVRICSAYGAGFFYIPGTDTCLRVSGRARFEYQYSEQFSRNAGAGNISGYRALGRMNLDARTQTAYGTLRAFVRFDIASRTGQYLFSGTQLRTANAFAGQGIDHQQNQKFVELDKAFIQFAGITAGRAASFYDFYAHDFELIGSSVGSDVASTNLFAYTAQLGNGFSATISAEDPTFRRTPIFNVGAVAATGVVTNFGTFTSAVAQAPVVGTNGIAFVDVTQKNRMPDIVGNVRYDAPWGSAQLSAAVHEIAVGNFSGVSIASVAGGPTNAAPRPQNEYGWAVQGGLKINTPFIGAGDAFYLQGAYGQGASNYAGISSWAGGDANTTSVTSVISVSNNDAVVNPFTGRTVLSDAFSVVGSYLHYWTPEWRSAVFGSYGEMHYPTGARGAYAALGNFFNTGIAPLNSAANVNAFNNNATLRDWNIIYVGASLIWSPVRDLDIGVEGVYQRLALQNGRAADLNTFGTQGAVAGVPLRTRSVDDNFLVRFRVQRDF